MNIQEPLNPNEKIAANVTARLARETVTSVSRLTTGNQNYVYAVVSQSLT